MADDDANEATESKSNTNVESVTEGGTTEVKVEQEEVKEESTKAEQPAEEKKELAIEDKGSHTKEQVEEVREREGYLTVKEVATDLKFSTAYVSYLLAGDPKKGIPPRIRGIKVFGGSWRIPKSEYDRLIKEGPLPLKKPGEDKEVTRIKVEGEPEERVIEGKGKSTIKKLKVEEKPNKWPHIRINLLNIK